MNADTFHRLYTIGGAELALRYAEMSAERRERRFRIEKLRLFECGGTLPEEDDRVFADRFPRSSTRYVYFQVDARNPREHIENEYAIVAKYYSPDGSVMGTMEQKSTARPGWGTFWHCRGRGWEQPGHWQPGKYRVEVAIYDFGIIAGTPDDSESAYFEIYEDKPNPFLALDDERYPFLREFLRRR
jgi:hypothetical protein